MRNYQEELFFYHIYPLGALGAPKTNDFLSAPVNRLDKIAGWARYIRDLGANAVYLGPVFESGTHGYDTRDYFCVDRRIGTNDSLIKAVKEFHDNGISVVLDAVLNHTGRDFFAFRDLQEKERSSGYAGWYREVDFSRRSRRNDRFSYRAWQGIDDLPELNHENPEVKQHLFDAIKFWINEFGIDGLRLDAADALPLWFITEVSGFARMVKPDIWLLGEVIHGDYNNWAGSRKLDSITNYEAYKGLYSAHNDRNYFEIAYSLNRQYGAQGMYRGINLYNFGDNHDVTRISSILKDPADIYPLHILLFCMPGIPSVYYGSEAGIKGIKGQADDWNLRPSLEPGVFTEDKDAQEFTGFLKKLWQIRRCVPALKYGDYSQLNLSLEMFAFCRRHENKRVIIAINQTCETASMDIAVAGSAVFTDVLNNNEEFHAAGGKLHIDRLWPKWGRILVEK